MELQSFYLKLNEMKEYEQAKQERQEAANKEINISSTESPFKPITTKRPKTKQEIHARIGLNQSSTT